MLAERPQVVPYEEAIGSDDAILRLKAHALGAAIAVVPVTVAAFMRVTPRRTVEDAVSLETGDADHSFARAWERYLADGRELDPFAPEQVAESIATVLTLDDLGGGAAPFRWYLRALGLGDRITMYLRSAGTIVAAIVLGRSVECERFTKGDARTLRRIQPLIEHAYLCAVEPRGESAREALRMCGLTARETDVAELVGRGATNAEIARSLHLSEATVKTHLMRIFAKAGVRSRTQLALLLGAGTNG